MKTRKLPMKNMLKSSYIPKYKVETKKAMSKMDGIGQCVLDYDHGGCQVACGMTFFQCGMTPIILLTDLDRGVSITNSIESAATAVYAMHFLHVNPLEILFFEHYSRDGGANEFFRVKMLWNRRVERFCSPEFSSVSEDELGHLLSCYGYHRKNIPSLKFKSATIMQFPSAPALTSHL